MNLAETRKLLRKLGWVGKIDEDIVYLWMEHGINTLCEGCTKQCKQHGGCKIIECPLYDPLVVVEKKTRKRRGK